MATKKKTSPPPKAARPKKPSASEEDKRTEVELKGAARLALLRRMEEAAEIADDADLQSVVWLSQAWKGLGGV